jgi:hypothetical protein
LKLKHIRVDPNSDFACDTPPINMPLHKLDGRWFSLVTWSECAAGGADAFMLTTEDSKDDDSIATPRSGSVLADRKNVDKGLLENTNEQHFFRIQIFHRGPSDESKQPKAEVIRSFSQIVSFHAVLSECMVDMIHHPLFYQKSMDRTAAGEMSTGLKNALGISPLDCVRISGAFLAGVVDATTSTVPVDIPPSRHGKLSIIRYHVWQVATNDLLTIDLSSRGRNGVFKLNF